MRIPANTPLVGDRGVALNDTLTWVGADFTGSTMRAQVRLTPDTPGSPPIALSLGSGLTLTYGGTDTIANHVTAGRLSGVGEASIYDQKNPATGALFAAGDSVALSVIALHIAATSMVAPAIPAAIEPGDDVVLAWDLLITPPAGSEDKYFTGEFRVRGTVVQ